MKRSVLFVCVHNSARSQMAEAFLNEFCQNDFAAESGLEPGYLSPLAVTVMQEVGIDLSENVTKSAFDLFRKGRQYLYVITACDETSTERCPIFPGGTRHLHGSFRDPASVTGSWDERVAQTRRIRDEIRANVQSGAMRFVRTSL
jgi:arsenate reductase